MLSTLVHFSLYESNARSQDIILNARTNMRLVPGSEANSSLRRIYVAAA
jgi:hypothetical protein